MGGLSRKAHQIKEITAKAALPSLFVDAGNLLFARMQAQATASQELIAAEGIAVIYAGMALQALGVGPLDLAAGPDFLRQGAAADLPWVSANLYDEKGGLLFEAYKSVELAGLKIALVGLTGNLLGPPEGFSITDGSSELAQLLPELTTSHDMVILLSSLPHARLAELTRDFPQINLIIGADRRQGTVVPRLLQKTLVTQTAEQGKYLGVLTITWNNRPWGQDQTKRLPQLHNQLRAIHRQIQVLKNNPATTGSGTRLSQLEEHKAAMAREITAIEKGGAEVDRKAPSTFSSSIVALTGSVDKDPLTEAEVQAVKQSIEAYNR